MQPQTSALTGTDFLPAEIAARQGTLAGAWRSVRENTWVALGLSVVIIPCLWHRHIEAGDLGSHVYNAWLAQLIGSAQAPGLYLARQWSNVLFDLALLHTANAVGFAAAEKIVVSLCVLIFFWGVFAFVGAVSGRPPWLLTPALTMLAYGYAFNMGFFNYYLSVGLGCLALAVAWKTWPRCSWRWILFLGLAGLTSLAHPLGVLWIAGAVLWRAVSPLIPGWWKLLVPAGELFLFRVFLTIVHNKDLSVDWNSAMPFYQMNGSDQLALYGRRYVLLAWAALILAVTILVVELLERRRAGSGWKGLQLPLELYGLLFFTMWLAPENLRLPLYPAWVGLLASRLTALTAIAGLAVLGCARPRKWHFIGFLGIAAFFFTFLYQDTSKLNRMEANAEMLLSTLPVGTRVIPTVFADPDWRVEFIVHAVDRACMMRCFVYSNYEPSSKQFRVRVAKGGSWIATASAEDAEAMQGGGYEIHNTDLPAKRVYQCTRADWTRLCMRDLVEGESTGDPGARPGG
jgi:hypothetical protein